MKLQFGKSPVTVFEDPEQFTQDVYTAWHAGPGEDTPGSVLEYAQQGLFEIQPHIDADTFKKIVLVALKIAYNEGIKAVGEEYDAFLKI